MEKSESIRFRLSMLAREIYRRIEGVKRAHPDLNMSGFGYAGEEYELELDENLLEQVINCMNMLHGVDLVRKYSDRTSYGFKHDVENACGIYISNGAFIMAALIMGFSHKRSGKKNACFNFNEDSFRKNLERGSLLFPLIKNLERKK
jgi:hypothetical protein